MADASLEDITLTQKEVVGGESGGLKTHVSRLSTEVSATPSKESKQEEEQVDEDQKFTFVQACGMNTMYMFGTGPLITLPYCIASADPVGPHALVGYGIACLACFCDALVCGEVSSMWPESGGSYIYLRNLYGRETWGRVAAFIFFWQFLVSGPAEIASGFIAIAEYMVFFDPNTVSYGVRAAISLGLLAMATFMLYRNTKEIGGIANFLAGVTIFAMIFAIVGGFSDWHAENLVAPPNAYSGSAGKVLMGLAAATRFGVYDMTGYYDVCFIGGEIRNAKVNVPKSCIVTCGVVAVIYIFVYVAVLGHLDWRGFVEMYGDDYDGVQVGIMSTFTESLTGSKFLAYVMTIVVGCTIFGSVFSMILGFTHLLFTAADQGFFYSFFAHKHPTVENLPDRALLSLSLVSAAWCFFSIDVVIDAMTVMLVWVQFFGQSVGLLWYRYNTPKEEQPEGWRMPLYPLPCIIQAVLFFFIGITSDSYILYGSETPTLELSVAFLLLGGVMYVLRAKVNKEWPYNETDVEVKKEVKDVKKEVKKEVESMVENYSVSPVAGN